METFSHIDTAERTHELGALLPEPLYISGSLEVRKIESTDTDALYRLVQFNPDIRKRVAWAADVQEREDVIPSLQRRSNENMDGRFAIIGEDNLVGYVGVHPGSQVNEYGMGYCLDKDARGRGYATKVVVTLIEELKGLGAKHIYFQIVPDNEDSIAIPQRLGFYPAETVPGVDFPVLQQRWRLELR